MIAIYVPILAFFAVFLIAVAWWYIKLYKVNKYLGKYPQPLVLPLVGHAYLFRSVTDIIPIIQSNLEKHGKVGKVIIGFHIRLGLAQHKAVEFLLRSTSFIKKPYEYTFLHRWLGTGLLTSWGDKWKRQRKLLTPAFHFQILEQFIDIFDRQSSILVERLQKEVGGGGFDIFPYISLCTLDVICEAAMGTSVNAQKSANSAYVRSVKEVCSVLALRIFSAYKAPNFIYRFTSDYRRQNKALETVHGHTNSVIVKRRQELINDRRLTQDDSGTGAKKRLAFLDLLLQYSMEGKTLTDEEIREEVDTFMFEGHDTVSSGLSFTLYCLSKHPEIQEKVVEELRTIFSDDKVRVPTHQDLQDMKYLEMVIKETLRLYPPVTIFSRLLEEEAEFDGGTLPKGLPLSIFTFGLHRDADVFPDPERFDPERFSPENSAGRSPFAYVPFSAGPRNCIGQRFAVLEMKSTISKVLRKYEVLPVVDHIPAVSFELILKSANGLCIRLKNRDF